MACGAALRKDTVLSSLGAVESCVASAIQYNLLAALSVFVEGWVTQVAPDECCCVFVHVPYIFSPVYQYVSICAHWGPLGNTLVQVMLALALQAQLVLQASGQII